MRVSLEGGAGERQPLCKSARWLEPAEEGGGGAEGASDGYFDKISNKVAVSEW